MHAVQNEKELWSKNRIASELGLDRRTVDKYLKDTPPTGSLRGHPAWSIRDFILPIGRALGAVGTGGVTDPDLLPPKERKDWYQAENERIKLEKELGVLIPKPEVREEMANLVKPIASTLDNLGDILERDCAISREALLRVQEVLDTQRELLYQALTKNTGGGDE